MMYILLMDRMDWSLLFGDFLSDGMNWGMAFGLALMVGLIFLMVVVVAWQSFSHR